MSDPTVDIAYTCLTTRKSLNVLQSHSLARSYEQLLVVRASEAMNRDWTSGLATDQTVYSLARRLALAYN